MHIIRVVSSYLYAKLRPYYAKNMDNLYGIVLILWTSGNLDLCLNFRVIADQKMRIRIYNIDRLGVKTS